MPKTQQKPAYGADRCQVSRVHRDGSITMACKFIGAPVPITVRLDPGTVRKVSGRW